MRDLKASICAITWHWLGNTFLFCASGLGTDLVWIKFGVCFGIFKRFLCKYSISHPKCQETMKKGGLRALASECEQERSSCLFFSTGGAAVRLQEKRKKKLLRSDNDQREKGRKKARAVKSCCIR